jgi:pimeloyl-ACP methyl ester carboxylesterase
MTRVTTRLFLLPAIAGLLVTAGLAAGKDESLKRRGFLGAQLWSINEQVKAEQKLTSNDGAEVRDVIAGSAAEAAGVRPGDVLLAINDVAVKTPAEAVTTVGRGKAGDVLALALVRDTKPLTLRVTLKERPRESSETFEVVYGAVTSKAGRQRTILTRPKGPGRHPALFLIQGLGCYSVEGTVGRPAEFQLIANAFTEAGYVTLRVDKPGCGDSDGGPCADVDFLTELDGYRQGLKMLKARDDVDPDRVILFGHSLGGLWAPIVASEEPVRGVAVYGTVLKPWYEYELENRRRQAVLDGSTFPEIDRDMRAFTTFLHELYLAKKEPDKIVAEHPELADIRQQMCPDGTHMYGRSVAFMRQVAALPISEYWSKVNADVLALWGKAEYVSTESDHRMLADLINKAHPGRGKFEALDGMDHGFYVAASAAERYKQVLAGGPSEFNPLIIDTLRGWTDGLVKAGKEKGKREN